METIKIPLYFNKENKERYNQEKIKDYILNNHKDKDFPMYGELVQDNLITPYSINLSEITHKIKNVSLINDTLVSEIDILDTPKGKIVQELIKENIPFKLTPRVIIDGNDKNNCQLISLDLI